MKPLLRYVPQLLIFATSALIAGILAYLISLLLYVAGVMDLPYLFSSSSTFEYPIPMLIGILVTKALLMFTLLLLLKVLFALKSDLPFERHIIKRFYVIGFIVLILPILNSLPIILSNFYASPPYIQFYVVDSIVNRIAGFVITGIMLLAFAHVLKSGLSIYEEQKLTV